MRIEETNKLTQSEQDQISDKHFPAIYIGTLAVSSACQGCKLGTILLMNALQRSYYVALPFVADDGVAAGEPTECFNPNAAVMHADALSRKQGYVRGRRVQPHRRPCHPRFQ
jgi:hypothetical protein